LKYREGVLAFAGDAGRANRGVDGMVAVAVSGEVVRSHASTGLILKLSTATFAISVDGTR
jgi:hypothetical protein